MSRKNSAYSIHENKKAASAAFFRCCFTCCAGIAIRIGTDAPDFRYGYSAQGGFVFADLLRSAFDSHGFHVVVFSDFGLHVAPFEKVSNGISQYEQAHCSGGDQNAQEGW